VTLPLPLPLAPAVMDIQDTFDLAVQAQPLVVVTLTLFDDAPAATLADVGDAE
jgi:hypothetical protein